MALRTSEASMRKGVMSHLTIPVTTRKATLTDPRSTGSAPRPRPRDVLALRGTLKR